MYGCHDFSVSRFGELTCIYFLDINLNNYLFIDTTCTVATVVEDNTFYTLADVN